MKDREVFCTNCGNPIRFRLPDNVDLARNTVVVTCPKCGSEYSILLKMVGIPVQAVFRPNIRS